MENENWKQLDNWIIGTGCVVAINGFNFWNKEREFFARTGNALAYSLQWLGAGLGLAGVAIVLIGIDLKQRRKIAAQIRMETSINSTHLRNLSVKLEILIGDDESDEATFGDELPFVRARPFLKLPNTDLSGQDFAGAILRNSDLSGANLSKTIFIEADLRDSDLGNTNLSGADLSRADLRNADLTGANLKDVVMDGADLSGATMPDGSIHL